MHDQTQDTDVHQMVEVTTIDDVSLFTCPVSGCGREVSLDRGTLEVTVLRTGDFFARHRGSTPEGALVVGLS